MPNSITLDVVFLIRKIGFYVFIVVAIVAAIWGYLRLKESKEPKGSVIEHIPANVTCVIETKNFSELVSRLTRQNLIWNSLLSNSSMQVAQNGIRFLDSLVNSSPDIAGVIFGNSIYWTFYKKEKTSEHVILFKVKEKNNKELFEEFFDKVFSKDASVSSFEAYYFTNNKQKWLVCYNDGIVYVSSDLGALQNCIEQNKTESLAKNKAYTDLLKENGEQNTQVYFNHALTHLFSKSLFTQQSLFGVDVQLNEITLTGYSNEDSVSLFNSLKNQQAENIAGYELMPNNPDIIQAVTLSDINLFYRNIEKQQAEEKIEVNAMAWQILNDSALYNIKAESFENIDREVLSATYVLENITGQILSLKIKDEEKAALLLKLMSDSILTSGELKTYKLNKNFNQLFSFTNTDLKNEYGCLNGDHILFFSNKQLFDYYQQAVTNSQLLGKNAAFMSYANDNLSLDCNYIYYENAELMKLHNLNSIINSEEIWMSENAMSQLSLTAKNYKNNVQVRINVSHAQPKTGANNSLASLWAFTADSSITSGANIFVNHLTQENELCFQDELKQLYLINSTGNQIWKKKVSETIRSEIHTVDIFKNGKFQLLFNTDNYLHLVDRNGNYVQGFPVKLPAKATSDITLLDYDGNKDYRIFLACADKHIYNFNLYGVRTEGFVPVKTDAEVVLPISYIKVGPSDYLITTDISGKIYVFSRKGLGRIDFKNKTIENLNHLYVLGGNNLDNTKLVYVDDKNNLLNKISLADKKEALKIGDELNGFKTSFALVNDDSQTDMLVYGNGAFYSYDLFTGKLIEYFNEQAVYDDAQMVQTSDNDWIVAYDRTGQKVDVINTAGKLGTSLPNCNQKPLVSNLYKNGKTYVLLISGNKITCQELN
ncbi:MAG: hypothetical protein V4677_04870 [Bacteroidota bacterium]